MIFKASEN